MNQDMMDLYKNQNDLILKLMEKGSQSSREMGNLLKQLFSQFSSKQTDERILQKNIKYKSKIKLLKEKVRDLEKENIELNLKLKDNSNQKM